MASVGWGLDLVISPLIARLFWIRPTIAKRGHSLVASSNWRTHLLTLGAYSRTVTVDTLQNAVRVSSRRFWFLPQVRRIPFNAITAVLYGYADLSTGSLMSGITAYQSEDFFTVGLKLSDGSEFALFRFYGSGDFVNDSIWPDWMYWDVQIDAAMTDGPQERESLAYAETLSRLIGVPLEQMRP